MLEELVADAKKAHVVPRSTQTRQHGAVRASR
jgi:hypothetical protein